MSDTHGWEMLDTTKLAVHMADIKNTILQFQTDINSRLDTIDERLNKLEEDIDYTKISVDSVSNTINKNYKHYERNKVLYMEILQRLSVTNERVKPLLDELNRNTLEIQNKFCNPFIHSSRVYNRFWRASVIPNNTNNVPAIENDDTHEKTDGDVEDINI